jgi:hypothetical protein
MTSLPEKWVQKYVHILKGVEMHKISKISLSLLLIPTITFCSQPSSDGKPGKGTVEIWRKGQRPSRGSSSSALPDLANVALATASRSAIETAYNQAQKAIQDYERERASEVSATTPTAPPSSSLTVAQPAQAAFVLPTAATTQAGSSDDASSPKSSPKFTDHGSTITAVSAVAAALSSSAQPAQATCTITSKVPTIGGSDDDCSIASDNDTDTAKPKAKATLAQPAQAATTKAKDFARPPIPEQNKRFVATTILSFGLGGASKGIRETEEEYIRRLIADGTLADACSTGKDGLTHNDPKIMERFPQALRNLVAALLVQTEEEGHQTTSLAEKHAKSFDATTTKVDQILQGIEKIENLRRVLPETTINLLRDALQRARHQKEARLHALFEEFEDENKLLRDLDARIKQQHPKPESLRPLSPLKKPEFVQVDTKQS